MAGTRKLASRLRFHDRGVTVATSIENWEIVPDRTGHSYGLRVDLGAGTVSNAGRRVHFAGARVLLPMTREASPTVRVETEEPLLTVEREVLGRCAARHAEDYAPDLATVLRELNSRRIKIPDPP